MAKNEHFSEGGKVGRSNATSIKLFSVDSYDLKFMSSKSGNYIFIIFESAIFQTFWKLHCCPDF
jgi:hypothetical protein